MSDVKCSTMLNPYSVCFYFAANHVVSAEWIHYRAADISPVRTLGGYGRTDSRTGYVHRPDYLF